MHSALLLSRAMEIESTRYPRLAAILIALCPVANKTSRAGGLAILTDGWPRARAFHSDSRAVRLIFGFEVFLPATGGEICFW